MPFMPLADSGVPFQFGSTGGAALVGSVVSATAATEPTFDVTLTEHPTATFRVTCLNYLVSGTPTQVAKFTLVDDGDSVEIENSGGLASFSPSQFTQRSYIEAGEAYITYEGAAAVVPVTETFAFLFEVWVDEAGDGCDEVGNVTRATVSGYTRGRVFQANLYGQETRCLVANFNGAIAAGREIRSATWETWQTPQVVMSNAEITQDFRQATVLMRAQVPGPAVVKCSVTLDNGEVYVQNFRINVLLSPVYQTTTWVTGPSSVTVTVS